MIRLKIAVIEIFSQINNKDSTDGLTTIFKTKLGWMVGFEKIFTHTLFMSKENNPFSQKVLESKYHICLKVQHCANFATYFVFHSDENMLPKEMQEESKLESKLNIEIIQNEKIETLIPV